MKYCGSLKFIGSRKKNATKLVTRNKIVIKALRLKDTWIVFYLFVCLVGFFWCLFSLELLLFMIFVLCGSV